MAGLLNGQVRLVLLQFAFSNLKHVPSCLKQKSEKTLKESPAIKGELCLSATEDVGVVDFIADLESMNYQLVDSYYQIRSRNGQQYAVVRFLFAEKEQASVSDEFKKMLPEIEQALLQICESAMWRARAFLNPFFKDGRIIDDVYALSVNLEARKPLLDSTGKPIFQWQKDENGEKIGDSPISLRPEKFLKIIDGDIRIVENP